MADKLIGSYIFFVFANKSQKSFATHMYKAQKLLTDIFSLLFSPIRCSYRIDVINILPFDYLE